MQMAAESKSLGFNSAALDILSNSVVNEPHPEDSGSRFGCGSFTTEDAESAKGREGVGVDAYRCSAGLGDLCALCGKRAVSSQELLRVVPRCPSR